jgi:hypothetical protein
MICNLLCIFSDKIFFLQDSHGKEIPSFSQFVQYIGKWPQTDLYYLLYQQKNLFDICLFCFLIKGHPTK